MMTSHGNIRLKEKKKEKKVREMGMAQVADYYLSMHEALGLAPSIMIHYLYFCVPITSALRK